MESSSHTDEDIKEECVEIISEVDPESVGNATAMFMSGENEPSMESSAVYMTDDQEAVPGSSTTILLDRDRDGIMLKPASETVMNLIELVRSQPEIWDMTNAAYKEKLLRRRSFRRVAEELGWSTEDVIKKYNNLRTYYTKEVIKQKRSPSYHSKWPYFERLDSFLRRTVHRRQPRRLALANRLSRLTSRNTPDRLSSFESSQLHVPSGFRRKRQVFNSGDVRHTRSNFTRASATLSAPPVEISRQSSAPLITSSAGTRVSQSSPINISQVRSLAPQQPPRETVSTTPPSAVTTRGLQIQMQKKQNQPQPQHPQQLQQQHTRPMSPPSSASKVAASSPMSQSYQSPSTMLPSPSSGQPMMESNDIIFGRLVTSQLSKIKEGRKKEQLKINLMQQLVQAMFDEEHP